MWHCEPAALSVKTCRKDWFFMSCPWSFRRKINKINEMKWNKSWFFDKIKSFEKIMISFHLVPAEGLTFYVGILMFFNIFGVGRAASNTLLSLKLLSSDFYQDLQMWEIVALIRVCYSDFWSGVFSLTYF